MKQRLVNIANILFMMGILLLITAALHAGDENMGYYRYPALHGKTIVFTAEGDLWKVSTEGGIASRLTTHAGQETHSSISPDGSLVAFTGNYNGPAEVYVMPVEGGIPKRLTFHGEGSVVAGWTPDGKVMYSTRHYSTLPNTQLVCIDPETLDETLVPLHQASAGAYDPTGETLIFTRLPFQGSRTKRYKGGTAQNLWKFAEAAGEAVPLTADYSGTSKDAMWYEGRIYFVTDRDGTMNIWSMTPEGADLQQETDYMYFDIQNPEIDDDNIIYQIGADLYIYNIPSKTEGKVTIFLASDFEQRRKKWVENPARSITDASISDKGEYISLTSRGRVFVAPVKTGRFVEVTRKYGIRYKNARFLPGTKNLIMQSDESGEVEYWKAPLDGMGEPEQLSSGSTVLMNSGKPSPDGKYIAWSDKDLVFWLLDVDKGTRRPVDTGHVGGIGRFAWSPDSKWIAYEIGEKNQNIRIKLMNIRTGESRMITTERLDSRRPAWDPEGKWLYFCSDRVFRPRTGVWGPRQPEPYYDRTRKIYMLALQDEHEWPFLEKNELMEKEDKEKKKDDEDKDKKKGKDKDKDDADEDKIKDLEIDLEGLETRLYEVPVPSGNYSNLSLTKTHLYYTDYVRDATKSENVLKALKITSEDPEPKDVLKGIRGYELSADGKKIVVRKSSDFYVFDANGSDPGKLEEKKVSLSGWNFMVDPVEEWKQIFTDAWRSERDYFYDPNLHGVDWQAIYDRHLPLVDRVTEREELNNLIAQVLGELSALHIFVGGGDIRRGKYESPSALGARLEKDADAGGFRIKHIYLSDPDYPEELSPLARPHSKIKEGDVITAINGIPVLEAEHPSALLVRLNRKQVRLTLKDAGGKAYDEIVKPISQYQESGLRYREWEYTRRLKVDEMSDEQIGYVHLRAMGSWNFTEFIKGFYPVFNRPALIIDVRHNRGGNIDAWILEKLIRKAWMYWAPRAGQPYWNMHYAFRGHMIVLVNERTASDGEAFAEGFRRLGLGKLLGTRTWGGEIWLNSSVTVLVDRGNATAAMYGVYDEKGNWLIEGHGVDPDIVVDNLPHSTFKGEDAQLDAAVKYLQELIREDPREVPPVPPYPDKSFDYTK
jgi:tricorn protease